MSPSEMLSRVRQGLMLLQSVHDDIGVENGFLRGTTRSRLKAAMDRIESCLPLVEQVVQSENPKVPLRCTHEGKSLDIYICGDVHCPVHGSRNKLLWAEN